MQHIVNSRTRYVLVHYRLFRTGGHVIDTILEKNFFDSMASISGAGPNSTVTNVDLLEFLDPHPQISAISSYHLRPPKPELDSYVFFDIFLLRDPLDRLYSIFEYHKQRSGADPLDRLARECELGEFLDKLVSDYPHFANDSQVCYLATSGRYFRPPDRQDLEKALTMLERAAVPATTSHFDEALVAAEYYLRPAFPNLDLSYVAPPRPSKGEYARPGSEYIKEACSRDTYRQVLQLAELDIELLNRASQEIWRRFKCIPNSDARLKDFRQRCSTATEYFLEYDDVNA